MNWDPSMAAKDFLALISGGKDSMYTIGLLKDRGYKLSGLLYMWNTQTIDSYMFQTVGSELINAYAECLRVPLIIQETNAHALTQTLDYEQTNNDEVEDLVSGIKKAQKTVKFSFISTGAIKSIYQKNRVDYVCGTLGIGHLAPLWDMDQKYLLSEMIQFGIDARIVKIASDGFGKECIGMNLKQMRDHIGERISKNAFYRWFNYCGEGGEYETLVLDAPFFKKRIELTSFETKRHPEEPEKEWNVFFMKDIKHIVIEK